jgi:3-oxoacyl-[acyl-carrier protein] reductase
MSSGGIQTSCDNRWQGRVAVVTGSSTGIGHAIALSLAGCGAAVVLHGRTESAELKQTANEISAIGGKCLLLAQDLSHHESLAMFVESCWDWHGVVHAWVNNAGVDVLTGDFRNASFEEKLAMLWSVDVLATISLSRLVGSKMRDAHRRSSGDFSIVNIGWDQAEQGMDGDSGQMFATTKGAVMAFSKSLAQELAPEVRVNVVAPGWIKTAWGNEASEEWQRRAIGESLVGRWGTPEDVARVVSSLVDPSFDFVTGQVWKVNGGFKYGRS